MTTGNAGAGSAISKSWLILLAVLCLLPLSGFAEPGAGSHAIAPEHPIRFTIMHTNDFHSQMTGLGPDLLFTPRAGDDDPVLGHAARLMTAIRSVRANRMRHGHSVMLFDAGDALFGTLFHMLAPSANSSYAPEYRFFHEAGYDAMSLGNHDFDADEKGLALALEKAQKAGYILPFVTTNLRFAQEAATTNSLHRFAVSGGPAATQAAFQEFQVRLLPGGADQPPIRVGILGMVGPNAAQLCTTTRKSVQFVGFDDKTTKADEKAFHAFVQSKVDLLRREQQCHIVVVLLHGGTPEDENLAGAVKGIDLIVAGHTHQAYNRKVGNTLIAQAGHGGANLGVLDLEYNGSGLRLLNQGNSTIAIDDSIPADPEVLAWLKKTTREVDRLIRPSGFAVNEPICMVTRDRRKASFPNNHAAVYTATNLLRAVNRRMENPVDIYFSTYGLVRSEYLTVNGDPTMYAFSDIFRFSPLGFAADGSPGAPIVIFSLSRAETKLLLEILTWQSKKFPVYEPVVSDNLRYTINTHGIPLANKVSDLELDGKSFLHWPRRIRIAATLFCAQNLLKIRNLTKGVIRITPRDDDGNELTEFPDSGLPREHILLADELSRIQHGEVSMPVEMP